MTSTALSLNVELIKKLMEEQNITPRQLWNKSIDVDQSVISKVLNNKYKNTGSAHTIYRIAKALGVPMEDLLIDRNNV